MARPERFELPTNWFEASYSIQLSYGRVIWYFYVVGACGTSETSASVSLPGQQPKQGAEL